MHNFFSILMIYLQNHHIFYSYEIHLQQLALRRLLCTFYYWSLVLMLKMSINKETEAYKHEQKYKNEVLTEMHTQLPVNH